MINREKYIHYIATVKKYCGHGDNWVHVIDAIIICYFGCFMWKAIDMINNYKPSDLKKLMGHIALHGCVRESHFLYLL